MRRGLGAVVLLAIAGVGLSNVPTAVTAEDRSVLQPVIQGLPGHPPDMAAQIASILAVQKRILGQVSTEVAIPLGQPREPVDLIRARAGLCFDISRSIEKALALLNMRVRHVAIFDARSGPMASLMSQGTPSHAMTEVLTPHGWMLVDSLTPWIGLTADGRPVSADDLRAAPGLGAADWDSRVQSPPPSLLNQPFLAVVGLYSRHGQFYAPYLPLPDVAWSDFIAWQLGD